MNPKPVVFDKSAFPEGFHATTLELIRLEVEREVRNREPKAKNKWEQPVMLDDGTRYAVPCKETADVVELGKPRQLKHKGIPRHKKRGGA